MVREHNATRKVAWISRQPRRGSDVAGGAARGEWSRDAHRPFILVRVEGRDGHDHAAAVTLHGAMALISATTSPHRARLLVLLILVLWVDESSRRPISVGLLGCGRAILLVGRSRVLLLGGSSPILLLRGSTAILLLWVGGGVLLLRVGSSVLLLRGGSPVLLLRCGGVVLLLGWSAVRLLGRMLVSERLLGRVLLLHTIAKRWLRRRHAVLLLRLWRVWLLIGCRRGIDIRHKVLDTDRGAYDVGRIGCQRTDVQHDDDFLTTDDVAYVLGELHNRIALDLRTRSVEAHAHAELVKGNSAEYAWTRGGAGRAAGAGGGAGRGARGGGTRACPDSSIGLS